MGEGGIFLNESLSLQLTWEDESLLTLRCASTIMEFDRNTFGIPRKTKRIQQTAQNETKTN